MKLFAKISLFLLLAAFVKAQHSNKQLDNLRMALISAFNNTIRMDVYDQWAYYFYEVNRDSSLLFSGKELLIAGNSIEDNVEVRVGDNGPGIPQRILDEIFQPFFSLPLSQQGKEQTVAYP